MSLQSFRDKINTKFKTKVLLPANLGIVDMPRFSSGILAIDIDTGGGYPENKIIEIIGIESSGKTYLANKAMATITNRIANNKALLIDEEGSSEASWLNKCGVNIDNLEICRSEYAEQALDILELAVQSTNFGIVVLDSIAALIPKEELDGSTDAWQMGLTARLMGKACRKMFKALIECKKAGGSCTVILINQIRSKIGVIWGSKETTPGGRAVKFATGLRIDLRKEAMLTDVSGTIFGQQTKYTCIKNKTSPPLKKGYFKYYIDGKDEAKVFNVEGLVNCGLSMGAIVKGGSWYSGDWLNKKIQGFDNVVTEMESYSAESLNEGLEEVQTHLLHGKKLTFRFKKGINY